jgi:hypothetical protein
MVVAAGKPAGIASIVVFNAQPTTKYTNKASWISLGFLGGLETWRTSWRAPARGPAGRTRQVARRALAARDQQTGLHCRP